ncbi:DNA-processing protein DprA [Jonesia quinghaiensis]|uniref:DNA-processing protein DprA n=1 Tax=Jonesia quinghaiensis TaxID=262806 RepID=UPI00040AE402|nr:DNA-processing protein DprA [Jonesia quinghaiensis]
MTALTDLDARLSLSRIAEPADPLVSQVIAQCGAPKAWELIFQAAHVESLGAEKATQKLSEILCIESPQQRGHLTKVKTRWNARLPVVNPDHDRRAAIALGAHLVCPHDDLWPARLDDLDDCAPWMLWVRGNPETLVTAPAHLSVVGSRNPTAYGEHVTAHIIAGLDNTRTLLVSGGAFGIDARAHHGALAQEMLSVAVLAGGVDRLYPAGNQRLLESLIARGCVVSEMPVGAAPSRVRFLRRNRLIAALSDVTLVVEAAWRSGSLSTARHAQDIGRTVLAVPGPVTSAQSAGCHRLIRDGEARLVSEPADVRGALESAMRGSGLTEIQDGAQDMPTTMRSTGGGEFDLLSEIQRCVFEALSPYRFRHLSDLAQIAGLGILEIRDVLGSLEVKGLVTCDRDSYRRTTQ